MLWLHQSRKLIPIQSVSSNSRRLHSYSEPEIILNELQTL